MHTPSGEFSAHWMVSQSKVGGIQGFPRRLLILSEELLGVFNEADDDDDGGAGHADKEHDFEDVHGEDSENHETHCIPDWN
jgi:hypothetical protein